MYQSIANKTGVNIMKYIQSNFEEVNKYSKQGIHKLNSNNCDKSYIVQNVNFNNIYKE